MNYIEILANDKVKKELNEIKSEIEAEKDNAGRYRNILAMNAYTDCLQIIEKHMKGGV